MEKDDLKWDVKRTNKMKSELPQQVEVASPYITTHLFVQSYKKPIYQINSQRQSYSITKNVYIYTSI